MAVFRVDKTRDYTVMSNYHLRDRNLSCKACGLLSKMLSLPEEWDYTTRGLAAICKDGVDSIGTALKELETLGYLVRNRLRDDKGRIRDTEYIIYETPHLPVPATDAPDTETPDMDTPDEAPQNPASPHTENPDMDVPSTEEPCPGNRPQLNTNPTIYSKNQITDESNTHSFLPSEAPTPAADGPKDGQEMRAEIYRQIEYDHIVTPFNRAQVDELVEIMLEVSMNRSPTIRIGRDAEYPTSFVRDRFRKLTSEHIEKVLDGIKENTTRVYNTKAYLMAALFNVVSTLDSHYMMLVNHDLSVSP